MKEFNYEKKISGMRERSRFKISRFGILRFLPREFKNVRGKFLDVGCGAGAYTESLRHCQPQLKVYGVDISKTAIKKAKKDFPKIDFSVASAYRLPFPDCFFDVVVMKCVLEHLENPDKALTELRRVLKPKGLFYSITPLEGDKLVLNCSPRLSWKYQGHFQRFSRTSLLSLLEKNGFLVERHYFWGFLFCQVINFVYYFLLDIFNLPFHFSVISCVNEGKPTMGKRILSCLRKTMTFLLNIESLLVPKSFPGLYMHVVVCNDKIGYNHEVS